MAGLALQKEVGIMGSVLLHRCPNKFGTSIFRRVAAGAMTDFTYAFAL